MRNIKKVISGVLILVFSLFIFAGFLGSPALAKDETIEIGVTLPMLEVVHWINQKWGYEDEAQKLGAECTVVNAGGYQNVQKQVNQIQDFLAKGVDVIIVAACNAEATINVVEEAIRFGVPVINVNNMTNSDMVYSKIRSDDIEMGNKQAELMIEALDGKGKVVMVNAPAGTTLTNRGKGFREYIEENAPGIEIIAEQFVSADPAQATAVMEDFLQTYPDIDGVFSWSDTTGVPIAHVVKSHGRDVVVTTMDIVNPDTRTALREGLIYGAVAQQPILLGRIGVRTAVKIAKGEDYPKQILAPILKVTKDNIDKIDLSGIVIPE